MTDYIKRKDAMDGMRNVDDAKHIRALPSADVAPVRHEEDGTLWVTVGDCEKVGRVIVKNEQGHFCRVFYMDGGDTDER